VALARKRPGPMQKNREDLIDEEVAALDKASTNLKLTLRIENFSLSGKGCHDAKEYAHRGSHLCVAVRKRVRLGSATAGGTTSTPGTATSGGAAARQREQRHQAAVR
jgi:hypothetical protein